MSTCLHCHSTILSTHGKKFCTLSCAARYNNARRAARTPESKQKTATATRNRHAASPAPPRTTVSQCVWCHKWFPGKRRTCSKSCYTHTSPTINPPGSRQIAIIAANLVLGIDRLWRCRLRHGYEPTTHPCQYYHSTRSETTSSMDTSIPISTFPRCGWLLNWTVPNTTYQTTNSTTHSVTNTY